MIFALLHITAQLDRLPHLSVQTAPKVIRQVYGMSLNANLANQENTAILLELLFLGHLKFVGADIIVRVE